MRQCAAEERVDGDAERAPLDVEQRHLDRGLRLEALRRFTIHAGQRPMDVERVLAHERGRQALRRVVDVRRGHAGVARRRIHVAPALDALVRRRPARARSAARWSVRARPDGLGQRDLDEDGLDRDDAHGGRIMHYPRRRDSTAQRAGRAVSSGRGDDRGAARGHPGRADDLRRGRSALHRPRARLQRSGQPARHGRRRARSPTRRAPCARWRRCAFPPKPSRPPPSCPISTSTRGRALEYGRMEPTASDPDVQQQFGMIVGTPDARAGECARHPQHPGRALGHLPGRLRPASRPRGRSPPARPPCARCSASSRTPSSARPSSTPRTGAIPISRRCRCTASSSRSRTRSTRRTCAPPPAATRATTSTSRRAITCSSSSSATKGAIIFAKAVNTEYNGRAGDPGGRHAPDQVLPSVLGYQRSTWGGNPGEPLRHHALGLARLELGLGRVGQRQSGHGQPRRGDARVVSRAGQPQRGGADPAAQVDAGIQRGRHRRRHLLRPQRHPLPHDRRLRQGARRA